MASDKQIPSETGTLYETVSKIIEEARNLILLFPILLFGCMANSRISELVNKNKTIYDVNISEKGKRYEFGLSGNKDIFYLSEDSLLRLKYKFYIFNNISKPIVLSSFSFTRQLGVEEISYKLYYRKDLMTKEITLIDSLPITIDNRRVIEIIAECSESYYQTDRVFINYNLKIGEEEYIRNIEYTRKTFNDFRPKWF